jgi:hypothetical protein
MQLDFLEQTGRYDDRGAQLYSERDLEFGLDYARGYIDEGETHDLIGGFELAAFRDWCEIQLRGLPCAF